MSAGTSRPVIAFAQEVPRRLPQLRRRLLAAAVTVQLDAMRTGEARR
jgi:hypothetical protein